MWGRRRKRSPLSLSVVEASSQLNIKDSRIISSIFCEGCPLGDQHLGGRGSGKGTPSTPKAAWSCASGPWTQLAILPATRSMPQKRVSVNLLGSPDISMQ